MPAASREHHTLPRTYTLYAEVKGHKLISQSVALRRSFALRWTLARFRFVI